MTEGHEKITDMIAASSGTPTSDLLEVVKDPGGTPDNFRITWDDWHQLTALDIYTYVYRNANISIPNASWTALQFNSTTEDDYGFHNPAVNPSRLTVPAGYGGVYLMQFDAQFTWNIAGIRVWRIRLNGATTIAQIFAYDATAFSVSLSQCKTKYVLSAGDFVEGQVYQNRGGALNVDYVAAVSPQFKLVRLGREP